MAQSKTFDLGARQVEAYLGLAELEAFEDDFCVIGSMMQALYLAIQSQNFLLAPIKIRDAKGLIELGITGAGFTRTEAKTQVQLLAESNPVSALKQLACEILLYFTEDRYSDEDEGKQNTGKPEMASAPPPPNA